MSTINSNNVIKQESNTKKQQYELRTLTNTKIK